MDVRILIADDEIPILELLSEFITKLGYQADTAQDVESAIELLKSGTFDIVLTDKNMPGPKGSLEGGMALLRWLKENAARTEVIMMTGYATIETAVEAMKLGAFDYIMKPIPLDELKQKLERLIQYRAFINSENTLEIYRTLHQQMLVLLENRKGLPEDQVRSMLKNLGSRIDNVFGLQRQYEAIVQHQTEALERIEALAEVLKDGLPSDSPYQEVVVKISEEAQKRV
ncbi:MAG: response regulator [Desulfosarcinaceae bacterium]|nr:response regulator [Desulfosarcinaceae bacterium]